MATLEAIPDSSKNINLVIFSCFNNDLQTFLPRFFSFRASKSDLDAYISPTNKIYETGFYVNICKAMYFFIVCQTKINLTDIR